MVQKGIHFRETSVIQEERLNWELNIDDLAYLPALGIFSVDD